MCGQFLEHIKSWHIDAILGWQSHHWSVGGFVCLLPEAAPSDRWIPFKENLLWTSISLFVCLVRQCVMLLHLCAWGSEMLAPPDRWIPLKGNLLWTCRTYQMSSCDYVVRWHCYLTCVPPNYRYQKKCRTYPMSPCDYVVGWRCYLTCVWPN